MTIPEHYFYFSSMTALLMDPQSEFLVVNHQLNSEESHELVFHGLDGHATILLNNYTLGKAENTFIRYRFDISKLINQNGNLMEIRFESPIISGKRLAAQSKHSIPPNCTPPDYHGECHVNYLRRMPASFGWDWGLAAPSVGIWKQVELVSYKRDLIIRDVTALITSVDSEQWKVAVHVFCEGPLHTDAVIAGKINVILSVENNESIVASEVVSLNSTAFEREVTATSVLYVPKTKVKLWWPNGYGDQPLYNLSTTFENESGYSNAKNVFIGFREAHLVQDFANASNPDFGRSFYFSINGVPIFAKGTNYIPLNIFLEETGNWDTIANLLSAVKEANMNIVRIWGGGIYADDYFYEQCDRLGIMVWQDMMFACSMYPTNAAFISNVRQEIGQQIRRLQHHASIVVWAGNNENEVALQQNWYNTKSDFELFKKEYVELYVNTVKKTVLLYDDTRTFLVSSPTNGVQSDAEGYIARNPYDPLYGDIHFYNYLQNSWLSDSYPMTRFSSEYGFQSLPSLSSLRKVAAEEDLDSLTTKFFLHRQHQPLGYLYVVGQILMHFSAPNLNDLPSVIYLSQVNQAWAVKLQTEWYRKWRTKLLPNGQGQTMGAMYWQLNDIWQAPSWSSIEFDGKWKMLHYLAKKFFAPVIVTAHISQSGNISVSLVSDLIEDLPDVEFKMAVFSWHSWTPVFTSQKRVTVKNQSATEFMDTSVEKLLESNVNCKSYHRSINTKCFVKFSLTDTRSGKLIHENFLLPSALKLVDGLPAVKIQVTVESCTDAKTCTLSIKTSAISIFVWLDANDIAGYFSDNGFVMTEPERTVKFHHRQSISPDQLQASLSIAVLDKTRLNTFSSVGLDDSTFINKFFGNLKTFLKLYLTDAK